MALDITLEKQDENYGEIKINLQEEDYKEKVNEKLKEYSKKANFKGFRPGKVPQSLISKMYGESIKMQEVSNMVAEQLDSYIRENELPVLGQPIPENDTTEQIDWNNQTQFEFKYEIGLVPEFSYDISEKVNVTKYKIKVDDDEVDKAIKELQKQNGETSHPEKAEEGDQVLGQMELEDAGETSVLIPLDELDQKQAKQFLGLQAEDTIEIDLQEVFDKDQSAIARATGLSQDQVKEIKGKKPLKVTQISRVTPAELNQELFDKTFGEGTVQNEEEFREKVREAIQQNYQGETENLLWRDIREKLVNDTDIPLPEGFLKRWLKVANEGQYTDEQIEEDFYKYLEDLKWNIISNRIAKDNNLEVTEEEILEKTKAMIRQQFGGQQLPDELEKNMDSMAQHYLQNDQDGKQYQQIRDQAQQDKVMQFIQDNISIQEKEVDIEEFKKAAQN